MRSPDGGRPDLICSPQVLRFVVLAENRDPQLNKRRVSMASRVQSKKETRPMSA
jgi:hypothetical protein